MSDNLRFTLSPRHWHFRNLFTPLASQSLTRPLTFAPIRQKKDDTGNTWLSCLQRYCTWPLPAFSQTLHLCRFTPPASQSLTRPLTFAPIRQKKDDTGNTWLSCLQRYCTWPLPAFSQTLHLCRFTPPASQSLTRPLTFAPIRQKKDDTGNTWLSCLQRYCTWPLPAFSQTLHLCRFTPPASQSLTRPLTFAPIRQKKDDTGNTWLSCLQRYCTWPLPAFSQTLHLCRFISSKGSPCESANNRHDPHK